MRRVAKGRSIWPKGFPRVLNKKGGGERSVIDLRRRRIDNKRFSRNTLVEVTIGALSLGILVQESNQIFCLVHGPQVLLTDLQV